LLNEYPHISVRSGDVRAIRKSAFDHCLAGQQSGVAVNAYNRIAGINGIDYRPGADWLAFYFDSAPWVDENVIRNFNAICHGLVLAQHRVEQITIELDQSLFNIRLARRHFLRLVLCNL
jgi:hypothetical protein